ncbi:MAG: hypothetical protein HY508_09270 [Acidobacteria bacterium]|nr:hypothetical protein [Acidobacteriota bacterium]
MMKTYLRMVNPILAVVVLMLCLWAAMVDDGSFKPNFFERGGIPTYFVAKGLFCSAALFILGKILEVMPLDK